MSLRFLTALPVYNEEMHLKPVLDSVRQYAEDILVVDDGSTDTTASQLATLEGVHVVTHTHNQGYGAALRSAFKFGVEGGYDVLVTIDCDGQHEPQRIPEFVSTCRDTSQSRPVDIVSGSRYLRSFSGDGMPPEERRSINLRLTEEINTRLGLNLTDAFCGFKAYQISSLQYLPTTENGYAMPLELWVCAAAAGLSILELPVPLIYLEEKRSFGGKLDDGQTRIRYYHRVLTESICRHSYEYRDGLPVPLCGDSAE